MNVARKHPTGITIEERPHVLGSHAIGLNTEVHWRPRQRRTAIDEDLRLTLSDPNVHQVGRLGLQIQAYAARSLLHCPLPVLVIVKCEFSFEQRFREKSRERPLERAASIRIGIQKCDVLQIR